MTATKTTKKRDLTTTEKRAIQLALSKVRVKVYRMSQKSIYNAKTKKELLRIEKSIWNITNKM